MSDADERWKDQKEQIGRAFRNFEDRAVGRKEFQKLESEVGVLRVLLAMAFVEERFQKEFPEVDIANLSMCVGADKREHCKNIRAFYANAVTLLDVEEKLNEATRAKTATAMQAVVNIMDAYEKSFEDGDASQDLPEA